MFRRSCTITSMSIEKEDSLEGSQMSTDRLLGNVPVTNCRKSIPFYTWLGTAVSLGNMLLFLCTCMIWIHLSPGLDGYHKAHKTAASYCKRSESDFAHC